MKDFEKQMRDLAIKYDLKLTENFPKIVNAKAKLKLGLRCPCHATDASHFCISERCLKSVRENGRCDCGCFARKEVK